MNGSNGNAVNSGNDLIIGAIDAGAAPNATTFQALDMIDGGQGTDTLKLNDASGAAISLANVSNVEIVEVSGSAGVSIDSTTTTGVTDLKVVAAGGAINADAGATTNVSVALKAAGAAVDVDGGNNVTVKLTDVAANTNAVTIGTDSDATGPDLGVAPKGDVVVEMTGKAYSTSAAVATLSNVTVTGGKTVSVTQKAAADTAAAAADTTNVGNKVVQGAVTVNANTDTTTITVKQDAAVAAKNAANTTGGVTETATVKFGALKGGDALAINGLTFTAATGVNLTAEEVASAFSNMVSGLANANTDTQGSQVTAKGVFTGAFLTGAALDDSGTPAKGTGYTAAAASGDTVVFTAARANQDATDITATLTNTSGNSVAPTVTIVQGVAHNATPTGGVMGVDAGIVTVAGGANATAVKTITVDGYAATGSSATGTTSALETLNLSNGGNFAVAQAAATLALNLTNVGTAAKAETLTSAAVVAVPAVLDLNNTATKTLNVQSNGTNTVDLQLDGATGTTTLNVSGTGLLDASTNTNTSALTTIKVTETAGLSLGALATANVTSVDTTGTTGAVTLTLDGSKAVYTGGAGADRVTISNANTAIAKAIDLGAGDDTLTLNVTAGSVAVPTVDLKGGDGVDTIAMSAADAVALSANGTFAGKIDGFEKLSIGNAAAAGTVNLANLDNINYVISANSASIGAGAVKEVFTADFAASGTIAGADTIAFDTTTITLAGGETANQIAMKVAAGGYNTYNVTGVSGSVVTFEAKNTGPITPDVTTGDFTITDADATTASAAFSTTTQGSKSYTFDLTGLNLNTGDTFTIGDKTYTALADDEGSATTIAGFNGVITIGGKSYTGSSTGAGVLVLTTTDATAPATLAYTAVDTAPAGGTFAAGAGNGAAVTSANVATEVFAAAFAGAGAIEDADTIVFDGTTITLSTGMTPAQIAAAVAAGTYANWTAAVDSGTNTTVNFTAKTAGAKADVTAFTFNNVTSATTKPVVAVTVTTQGDTTAAGAAALTIDKMASGGTLELTATGAGAIVKVTDAAKGTADVLNVVTNANGNVGTVTAADVETINLNIKDALSTITTQAWTDANGNAVKTEDVSATTLAVAGNTATKAITVEGAGHLTLNVAANTKLATVDAGNATGALTLNLSAHNGDAITVTGGKGNDVLTASQGATAKADVLLGGEGNDTLVAGSNGAKLTGGAGNDLFVLQAGTKEVNTYTSIQDFQAGDVLALNDNLGNNVTSFAKLTAVLNENTSVFSNFVDAAIQQATAAGQAVWFQFKGNAYVVVDNVETGGASADVFQNGQDAVIELVGIDLNNASFNSTHATVALI